jgi:threonyl-tRNA synthetase
MVVVGDRDQEAGAVSVRLRTGEKSTGAVPLDQFVADLVARASARELWPYAEGDGSPA